MLVLTLNTGLSKDDISYNTLNVIEMHASSVKDEPDLNNQTSRNQVFPVGKGEKARI